MDRPACNALAQFCADQRYAFNAHAWRTRPGGERDVVAVAAKYLSMTSWYGHEEELTEIADTGAKEPFASTPTSTGLQRESQAVGLDLARFSVAVRSGIALHRLHGAGAMERGAKPWRQHLVD
jgi:hypothetical protein